MLVFEYKMHFFQHRLLQMVIVNAFLIGFSVQMNPLATFLLVQIAMGPYYARIEALIKPEIEKAMSIDINLEDYEAMKNKL